MTFWINTSIHNSKCSNDDVGSSGDINLELPSVAMEWILCNSCTSNVDLANISNVNRQWRRAAYNEIQQLLSSSSSSSKLSTKRKKYSTLAKLLLPDMALNILWRRCIPSTSSQCSPLQEEQEPQPPESSVYCLAWFHPMGIQFKAIQVEEETNDDLDHDDDAHHNDYISSTANADQFNEKNSVALQTCSHEWRGYRNAVDILLPFGYCTSFVQDVIIMAGEIKINTNVNQNKKHGTTTSNMNNITVVNNTVAKRKTKLSSKNYNTTFAVRGATLARPDGYCLCWDEDNYHEILSRSNKNESRNNNMKVKKYWERKKNEKMKLLLPRMVRSNPLKSMNTQHHFPNIGRQQRCLQFLNSDGLYAVHMKTPPFDCGPVHTPITVFCVGIATEDGCFMSGLNYRLELGHMYPTNVHDELNDTSPICIATMDNSNDNDHEFLPSVLYPNTSRDEMKREQNFNNDYDYDVNFHQSNLESAFSCSDIENESSSTSSLYNCTCRFQNKLTPQHREQPKQNSSDDEVLEENILRGRLGPGQWHCYTAVFNDSNWNNNTRHSCSVIRVDGMYETHFLTSSNDDDQNSSIDCCNNSMSKPLIDNKQNNMNIDDGKKIKGGGAILDGLTIGSDHCFDMSLCFGEGSDDEGEGCIGELVVFKGVLDHSDILQIEQYLMEKHGIPNVVKTQNRFVKDKKHNHNPEPQFHRSGRLSNHWQDDEWTRQAHALMNQPPHYDLNGCRIPLRFLSKHRNVAWNRTSVVTGKHIKVTRIGSKSTESSDW